MTKNLCRIPHFVRNDGLKLMTLNFRGGGTAAGGGGEVGDLRILCSFTKNSEFAHLQMNKYDFDIDRGLCYFLSFSSSCFSFSESMILCSLFQISLLISRSCGKTSWGEILIRLLGSVSFWFSSFNLRIT